VLAGSTTRYVEGKGWVPAKPGDVFYIPDNVVHETKNMSTTEGLKLLVFRIHEKGNPIVNLRIEEAYFWKK
jgi:quercetin dioxygenase-like cupin family protein